jgi:glycosyltransferase involved in cell wall biosynthesis
VDYSVVIATYNYGRFLRSAIDSVLAQTVPPRKIIVVDDGSTDDTADALAAYGGALNVIRQYNGGQAAAWNTAFPHTTGEWVAFLDADDWWVPQRMQRCLAAAAGAGVVMHDLVVTGPRVQHPSWVAWTAVKVGEGYLGDRTVRHGLPWLFTPTSGFMARRELLVDLFPLDATRWRTCADAPLLHRCALRAEFRYIDTALGYYRVHGDNSYHQQGWYDGDEHPRIILENLWLLQRLAWEVHSDLRRMGRMEKVALWNNPYYSRMIGWVAGRRSWLDICRLVLRQNVEAPTRIGIMRTRLSRMRELHAYQRSRDHSLGATLRRMAAADFPQFQLEQVWDPCLAS